MPIKNAIVLVSFLAMVDQSAFAQPTPSCGIAGKQANVIITLGGNQNFDCQYTVSIDYKDGSKGLHTDRTYVSAGGTNRPVLGINLPKPAASCSIAKQQCTRVTY